MVVFDSKELAKAVCIFFMGTIPDIWSVFNECWFYHTNAG